MSPHPNRNPGKKPWPFYLKGPVPLHWLKVAIGGGWSASVVGIYLWHLRGLRKTSDGLIVTRRGAKDVLGIGSDSLKRGLTRLETAGLITCTRGRGKAIRVTIINNAGGPAPPPTNK